MKTTRDKFLACSFALLAFAGVGFSGCAGMKQNGRARPGQTGALQPPPQNESGEGPRSGATPPPAKEPTPPRPEDHPAACQNCLTVRYVNGEGGKIALRNGEKLIEGLITPPFRVAGDTQARPYYTVFTKYTTVSELRENGYQTAVITADPKEARKLAAELNAIHETLELQTKIKAIAAQQSAQEKAAMEEVNKLLDVFFDRPAPVRRTPAAATATP